MPFGARHGDGGAACVHCLHPAFRRHGGHFGVAAFVGVGAGVRFRRQGARLQLHPVAHIQHAALVAQRNAGGGHLYGHFSLCCFAAAGCGDDAFARRGGRHVAICIHGGNALITAFIAERRGSVLRQRLCAQRGAVLAAYIQHQFFQRFYALGRHRYGNNAACGAAALQCGRHRGLTALGGSDKPGFIHRHGIALHGVGNFRLVCGVGLFLIRCFGVIVYVFQFQLCSFALLKLQAGRQANACHLGAARQKQAQAQGRKKEK